MAGLRQEFVRRPDRAQTHHLMCPVCGALPGIACLAEGEELAQIYPSRRLSVAERNWRASQGWIPPELRDPDDDEGEPEFDVDVPGQAGRRFPSR